MDILSITNKNFNEEVLESKLPVLMDFYADWCGPCKIMKPIVENIADTLSDKVKVVKVNVDEEIELATKYGILSIPTLVLIKDGQTVTSLVGVRDKKELEEIINNNI